LEAEMGFARKRVDSDGRVRWAAIYRDLRGRIRSAGTFTTEKAANKAWQRAEFRMAEGRIGDPRRGRQTFRRYVEQEWLPNHEMEPSTRQGYTYSINKHVTPYFGKMRMVEILPSHVREWVTELKGSGVTPATIKSLKNILSAIFTTALNDQVTFLHPCKGVKTPTVAVKPLKIITPEQFDVIYAALPTDELRLLVETEIESGLRWGELTELRAADLDLITRILSRRVSGVDGQAGGAWAATNRRCQGCCQGQCSGRWTVTPRAWRAIRPARLIRCRRTVAGRAVA
jgi:integrase